MNAQEHIASVNANARRKHDDLPKLRHVVRPLLPKKPEDDNVSPSSRDTKNKKDGRSSSGRCARIEDDWSVHDVRVRTRSRMRGALTRRVWAC